RLDLVEPHVALLGPALLGDAGVGTDFVIEHFEALLALEPAPHLARQHGIEAAVEIDDIALRVDYEVAVDEDFGQLLEALEKGTQRIGSGHGFKLAQSWV